jgi:hypothetical protein
MGSGVTYRCSEERTGFLAFYVSGDLWKIREVLWVFACHVIYPQAALVFHAGSSMAGLGSQRVKQLIPNGEKIGIKLADLYFSK